MLCMLCRYLHVVALLYLQIGSKRCVTVHFLADRVILVGWPVGWLVGWLVVGWLAGWLVGWL